MAKQSASVEWERETTKRPPATFTVTLDETDAIWLIGVLTEVNGPDPLYGPIARAMDAADVDYSESPHFLRGRRAVRTEAT